MALKKAVFHEVQTSSARDAVKEIAIRFRKSLGCDPDILLFFASGPLWPESNMGKLLEAEFAVKKPLLFGAIGYCTSQFGIIGGNYTTQDKTPALSALGLCLKEGNSTRIAVFKGDNSANILSNARIRPFRLNGTAVDEDEENENWANWKHLCTRSKTNQPDLLTITNNTLFNHRTSLINTANVMLPHAVKVGGVCHSESSLYVSGFDDDDDDESHSTTTSIGLVIDGSDQSSRLRLHPVMCQGPQPFSTPFKITQWAYVSPQQHGRNTNNDDDDDGNTSALLNNEGYKMIAIYSIDNVDVKDLDTSIFMKEDGSLYKEFYIGISTSSVNSEQGDNYCNNEQEGSQVGGDKFVISELTQADLNGEEHPQGYLMFMDVGNYFGKQLTINPESCAKFHRLVDRYALENFCRHVSYQQRSLSLVVDNKHENQHDINNNNTNGGVCGALMISDMSRGSALYGGEEDTESRAFQNIFKSYVDGEYKGSGIPTTGFLGYGQFGPLSGGYKDQNEDGDDDHDVDSYAHILASNIIIIK
jgi:small ligand-binding sensory domain FIST